MALQCQPWLLTCDMCLYCRRVIPFTLCGNFTANAKLAYQAASQVLAQPSSRFASFSFFKFEKHFLKVCTCNQKLFCLPPQCSSAFFCCTWRLHLRGSCLKMAILWVSPTYRYLTSSCSEEELFIVPLSPWPFRWQSVVKYLRATDL